jgi:hypothetical protein
VKFTTACDDAMELGQFLQFLDDWLAVDHGPVRESLARFVGWDAYGVESLREDLAPFTLLLGESDGEGVFPPHLTGGPSDLAAQEPST